MGAELFSGRVFCSGPIFQRNTAAPACRGLKTTSPSAVVTTGTVHCVLAFFRQEQMLEAAHMGLLFYLTLFIVMCVFGWSVRGAG
jgi:membrane protein CcdC involved in cytochrome C biogenesis